MPPGRNKEVGGRGEGDTPTAMAWRWSLDVPCDLRVDGR